MKEEILSDFSLPWCQRLLSSPALAPLATNGRLPPPPWDKVLTNTIFADTLATPTTIRAWAALRSHEARDGNSSPDFLLLLSLGTGLGGFRGIAHGGFSALVLDQVMAMCSSITFGPGAVTAESWTGFRRSIPIPGVVVCRAVAVEVEGRRIRVRSTIEDGEGGVYCEGGAVYVLKMKEEKGAKI